MRAVLLSDQGVSLRTDLPHPTPGPGEVLLRVLAAGICETDLQLIQGYMNFRGILGHEFVGLAETGPFAGKRVVGEINCACRTCEVCTAGLPSHCPHRSVLGIWKHDGAFADWVAVPQINLHPVPDSVSTRHAVFVEPLAAAFQIPTQVPLNPQQRVIVLGDGRLGNLCAQVLRLHQGRVTVIGKHGEKLKRLSRLGIDTALRDQVRPTRQADIVVDCTGSPSGIEAALAWLKPRGTLVLKTTVAGTQTLSLAPLVIDEITVIGSRCGPFDRALLALERQEIDVESLIDGIFPLDDALTALHTARTQPVLKLLLSMRDPLEQ